MKRLLVTLLIFTVLFTEVTMCASFAEAINFTLGMEGSDLDTTASKGNIHSKYGVTKETIKKYNKKFGTSYSIKTLTKAHAKKIAKALYWKPYGVEGINNNSSATAVFDFLYNSNPDNATIIVERTVNQILGKGTVKVDGIMDSKTIACINKISSKTFVKKLCNNRLAYMKKVKTWNKYKKGWTARVNAVKKLV